MAEEDVRVKGLAPSRNQTPRPTQIKLHICPTTGGTVRLIVSPQDTVQGLKIAISRKLRIPCDRITLLINNRILKDGTLAENQITSETRLTLLPNMTSGMTFQRPENSVMQALENLSESQVNDFLSGRAPLLLAMRLGDHMMFVQLQLSTTQCVNRRSRAHPGPSPSTPTSPNAVFPHSGAVSPASLAEASRNLSQKLRDLTRLTGHTKVGESAQVTVSSRVPTPPTPVASPPPSPTCSNQGAVIDSMHHLGQGVYSGTFSGTLDPTLQDVEGKPRKDIGTIVHILNDLLGASPHYHSCRPFLVQHPTPRRPPSPREFTGAPKNICHNSKPEDNALRGKVRQLQMMMEERRMRRKARREMKAPYQWTNSRLISQDLPSFCRQTSVTSRDNVPSGLADTTKMEMPENLESSAYRNPNIEQETVAV